MPPTRIAYVITDLEVGGAQMALVRLLEGLDGGRFPALVVTMRAPGALAQRARTAGAELVSLGMSSRLPSPAVALRLARVLRRFAPDIVHGWMYHGNLAASLVAAVLDKRPPVVWCIRQSLATLEHEKRLTRWIIRAGARLSHRVACIVSNSESAVRQHAAVGFDVERFEVIPNGFDERRFVPSAAARAVLRSELEVPTDALLVGLIARWDPVKRHDLFLGAVGRAVASGLEVHAVMAGTGATPENTALSRLVARHGIAARCHLLGERHDVERVMPGLDVLVSASGWAEGFPNVVGEAMSAGVPCLVTDTGDCAAIVAECGVVVPPGDGDALARELERLLWCPAESRRTLGLAARARIAATFSFGRVCERYAALYERMAGSTAAPEATRWDRAAADVAGTMNEAASAALRRE